MACETWVQYLSWEDPLDKHSGLENSMDRGAWPAGSQKVRHDSVKSSLIDICLLKIIYKTV